MRLGLFSDVHGNKSALEAVLTALVEHEPLDAIVCAGDLVYLGASPQEVVTRLREAGVQAVRGNCEDYVVGLRPIAGLAEEQRRLHEAHIAWNRERLSESGLDYLRELPLTLEFEPAAGHKLLVCHATPNSTDPDFGLMQRLASDELAREYVSSGARIIAFGHWHGPFLAELGGMTLLNISSVSIPFDGQALAAYTIAQWHDGFWSFRQHRVGYDVTREVRLIIERDMPRPPWPALKSYGESDVD